MINEQSVDDALCMFCKRIYCEYVAKLLKINKNKDIISYRFLKKQNFQSNYATVITENIRQYVKSIVYDTRNRVSDDMECFGKGLWHEDCIIHYWKTAETACMADSTRIIIGNNVVVA